jgi:hypothetical protein
MHYEPRRHKAFCHNEAAVIGDGLELIYLALR